MQDLNAAVIGGRLVRIVIDPKRSLWMPKAHNHMFIFLDVRVDVVMRLLKLKLKLPRVGSQNKEYCVLCRRQRVEFLAQFWGRKIGDYKRWMEQRFLKENADEEKRIKYVKHVIEVGTAVEWWC